MPFFASRKHTKYPPLEEVSQSEGGGRCETFDKMKTQIHNINNIDIAELIADELLIKEIQDGLDLLVNVYYSDVDRMILYEKNIIPEFFDLKTGIAGEVLQKFSNYKMQLAIVGDFSKYESKSLNDFIFESNKIGQVNFVFSMEEALMKLSK